MFWSHALRFTDVESSPTVATPWFNLWADGVRAFHSSEEIVSGILNWVCPDCGGSMGDRQRNSTARVSAEETGVACGKRVSQQSQLQSSELPLILPETANLSPAGAPHPHRCRHSWWVMPSGANRCGSPIGSNQRKGLQP